MKVVFVEAVQHFLLRQVIILAYMSFGVFVTDADSKGILLWVFCAIEAIAFIESVVYASKFYLEALLISAFNKLNCVDVSAEKFTNYK
jgi:hypothetical protein